MNSTIETANGVVLPDGAIDLSHVRNFSFFSAGFDHLDEIEEKRAATSVMNGKMWRFWLKPEAETNIIFLTGQEDGKDVPILEEHQLKLNGNWRNWFTCLKNLGQDCPLCDAGDRPYTAGFFVVIDRTQYRTKDGNLVKDQPRVLAAKFKSLKQLKKYSMKFGGLVGIEFNVERTSNKSPSIGDVFIREDKHSRDELEDILGKPLSDVIPNWSEYLEPLSAADLVSIVGTKANDAYDDEDSVDYE